MTNTFDFYLMNAIFVFIAIVSLAFVCRRLLRHWLGPSKGNTMQVLPSPKSIAPEVDVEAMKAEKSSGIPRKQTRAMYLDNLKVLLTIVVVLYHSLCAFGALPASWYITVS